MYVSTLHEWTEKHDGILLAHLMCGCCADPMTADKMYIEVKVSTNKVRWISIRGSSKLEGFHKYANTVLSSGQTGAKLAAALLCNFVGRWNTDRGVANSNQRSYGIYDHRLVPMFDAVQNNTNQVSSVAQAGAAVASQFLQLCHSVIALSFKMHTGHSVCIYCDISVEHYDVTAHQTVFMCVCLALELTTATPMFWCAA